MHQKHNTWELFDEWNIQKQEINLREKLVLFREREIWWCSIGKNIGAEQDGKNEFFERPVLVCKKYNNEQFFGFPLTSKNREWKYHFPYHINGWEGAIILSQWRILSAKRLQRKVGSMPRELFAQFTKVFKNSL